MIACDPNELQALREDIDLAIAKQIVDDKEQANDESKTD